MGKILLFIFSLLISNALFALTSGQITKVNANAPFFILDSNSPCTQGPSCGYVGVTITNVSGSTLTQVRVDFVSSSNANFYLTGNQPSQVKLYTLAPGQSATAFFYMKYSCTVNDTSTLTYSISDANSGTVSHTSTIYTRSSISASAGGQVISNTATVDRNNGILLVDTVLYNFGNIKTGDEVSFGPCGNPSFDAGGLQLINCQIISSSVTGVTVGSTDKLYYTATGNNTGSAIPVKIIYYFVNRLGSASANIIPYAGTTSGNTNYKYTGNYAAAGTTVLFQSNPASGLNISKTSNKTKIRPGDTVTYTVRIINSNTGRTSFDYIEDALPNGATYLGLDAASQINSTNSGTLPSAGATGTIQFIGGLESSTFPYVTYDLAGGDSIKLIYQVRIGTANQSRVDANSAKFYIGSTGSTAATTSNTVCPDLNSSNNTSTSICSGNTLNLTSTTPTNGTGPYTYAWSGPSSFSANTQNTTRNNIQTSQSGTYTMTVTDALTCSTSVEKTVTVTQTLTPTADISAADLSICSGDTIAFSSSNTNTGAGPTYQWYKNGAPLSGKTNSTLQGTSISNGDYFYLQLTSNYECPSVATVNSDTLTASVTTRTDPSVTIATTSPKLCNGYYVLFTSNLSNAGTSTSYQWYKNSNMISGATADTFSTTTLNSGDTISLTISTNAECIVTSNTDGSNSIQAVCALPIKLISFKGEKKAEMNCFQWESTGEEAGSYYEIQGSTEGSQWETMKHIPSNFVGKSKASYQSCLSTTAHTYFRLSWVDANGSRSYGNVIQLQPEGKMWNISPNPARQNIQIIGLKGIARVTITNLEGKVLLNRNIQNESLPLEKLIPGMYFLQIQQGNQTESHKMIITE